MEDLEKYIINFKNQTGPSVSLLFSTFLCHKMSELIFLMQPWHAQNFIFYVLFGISQMVNYAHHDLRE